RHELRFQVVGNLERTEAHGEIETADGLPLWDRERLEQKVLGPIRLRAQRRATARQARYDGEPRMSHCAAPRGLVPATIEWGLRRRKSASSRTATAALSTLDSVCARSADRGACGEIAPLVLASVSRSAAIVLELSALSAIVSWRTAEMSCGSSLSVARNSGALVSWLKLSAALDTESLTPLMSAAFRLASMACTDFVASSISVGSVGIPG